MPVHPFDRYAPFTDLAALKAASGKPLRKSMRVNLLKCSVERFKTHAAEKGWKLSPVPWCAEAFFIDRDDRSVALGKDLLHLLGHTYMQEAASMLPVAMLDPHPGETILDMSSAPGSKTTQIAAAMASPLPPGGGRGLGGGGVGEGIIVCNDVQEKRLWTLKSSLHRCGVTNYVMTKKVGQWFARHFTERFDRVLCDAPCTAQGTSRKDSDALEYSSLENVGKMARLQRELLQSAIDAAKVGGRIVYSTCTLTPEENEDVVLSLLEKNKGKVEVVDPRSEGEGEKGKGKVNAEWMNRAIEDSYIVQKSYKNFSFSSSPFPLLRLWPHTFDTEGFFCAVLKKTGTTRNREEMDWVRYQEEELPRSRVTQIGKLCEQMYGTSFLKDGDRLYIRGDQLLLATEDVVKFTMPVEDYSLGIPFARSLDRERIRLSQETLTLRGHAATKNMLDLNDAQLELLFDGKDFPIAEDLTGDVILRYRDMTIGSSLAQRGILKNRLPRWLVAKS